jgi:hypothetical protein
LCSKKIKGWQNNPRVWPWGWLWGKKERKKKEERSFPCREILIQMCGAVGQVAPACLADKTVAFLKGLLLQ